MSYDEMTGNLLQEGKSIATSHRSICLSMLKGLTENYYFLLESVVLDCKIITRLSFQSCKLCKGLSIVAFDLSQGYSR